jgi:succinoglycan biosynthesis transport protein ExoP
MDNHSTITPVANGKTITVPPAVTLAPLVGFEAQNDDGNFRQILGVLKRRVLVISGLGVAVNGAFAYSTFQQEPVYQGNFQLLVEPVNDDNSLGKLTQIDANIAKPSLDYESQIQVLKSPELLGSVVKKLQSSYSDINYNSLLQDLTINRVGATKVIEVRYKSNNAEKIKVVLDEISKFYLNYSLEKRQTKLRQGAQFVDKQLPDIKNRVLQIQKELQNFRQQYGFINPETQAQVINQQMQSLAEQRLNINQQLAAARANFVSLKGTQGELAALNNAPTYQQLISQQRQLEAQISGELARFQPDNPTIQMLEEKRQNLLPLLQQEAKRVIDIKFAEAHTALKNLDVQSQSLAQAEQELQQRVEQLPVLARKYNELQRDLQIATDSLNRFLTTRETLQIETAQTELPWELIKAATLPDTPISPNIQRNLLLGLVSSFLLGVGAALLMEKLDNTYHTLEDIKEKIKLPLLGILPFDKSLSTGNLLTLEARKTENVLTGTAVYEGIGKLSNLFPNRSETHGYYGQGQFWESLQLLYSNLQLLNTDKPIQSLVISSAMPGDGKSTVAFHLAQIATAMGKKVLLVDADLRRPQLHSLSDLNNFWGLSNLISNHIPMEQVLQQFPAMPELSIITSGPTPPDPARLLSSDKMKQLMAHFHQHFDLVIYDAPPMLGLADVRVLTPQTDGLVLVVRMDKTDKSALMQVEESLKISSLKPLNLLGIVVNGDTTQMSGYNYYYNRYREKEYR